MKTVDARGQLCPQPVMLAREAVQCGERELAVLVDNEISASNVTRFLENSGFEVTRSQEGENVVISARETTGKTTRESAPEEKPGDYAFLILSRYIGGEDAALGELLMKSFMGTLASRRPLPRVVALMNGGVKLALADSSCSDTLRELEAAGVAVLVCGTCAKHYDVTGQVAAGQISNMFEITEAVFAASKPIVLG